MVRTGLDDLVAINFSRASYHERLGLSRQAGGSLSAIATHLYSACCAVISLVNMTSFTKTTRSSARPLTLTAPTFPAPASEVVEHLPAFHELQRVASAIAFRNRCDPEEITQESASRISKAKRTITDFPHWRRYCAKIAFSRCSDEWRKRYRCNGLFLSMDEENEFGVFPAEQKASLQVFEAQLELEVEHRMIDQQVAALIRLDKSPTALPAAARRVLKLLLKHAASEDSYKKNGRLNGNAIAAKAEISQSTISRQLPVIQAAAVEVLEEMNASEEMEMC